MFSRMLPALAAAMLALPAAAQEAAAEAEAETEAEAQAAAAQEAGVDGEAETATEAQAGATELAEREDVRAGAVVRDPEGELVGTIESVEADGAVVSTGTVRAKLPFGSFGRNDRGLVISLSRAELEAAARAQSPG